MAEIRGAGPEFRPGWPKNESVKTEASNVNSSGKRDRNVYPVETVLPELKKCLGKNVNAILTAPPGAGKTTMVPLALLGEEWMAGRKMVLLEPRRLAARASAFRMADILGERVGETVGYRVRMDSAIGPRTRVEVVTEGILTRRLQNDPGLEGVGLVIFDEFHERSIHGDTGLALCLDVRESLREDLRILAMSATLDVAALRVLLRNAPAISAEGKAYPVETFYENRDLALPMEPGVANAVCKALRDTQGDILAFLPGAAEIGRVKNILAEKRFGENVKIVPLYGLLPKHLQDEAIKPGADGTRKIVLATSIAETSLTIDGVRVVVDSGFARTPRFDPGTGMTRLETVRTTRDSADQRRGRAGRTAPGVCMRLWTEATHQALLPRGRPEILNADLASLALELAVWGVSDPGELAWIDPPPEAAFAEARRLLFFLGALDKDGRVSAHGKAMAKMGLHPRLSHMVARAKEMGEGALACRLAVFLEGRDFVSQEPGGRDSDIRIRMEILDAVGRNRPADATRAKVDFNACRRILEETRHFGKRFGIESGNANFDKIGVLLAMAYPERIGRKRPGTNRRYLLANGRGAVFRNIEPICAEEYVVAAHLDGAESESRIFLAAPLSGNDICEHFSDRLERTRSVEWSDGIKGVRSMERVRLGALVLEEKNRENPDPAVIARAFSDGIRRGGLEILPWDGKLENWRARVVFLRGLFKEENGWPDFSDEALLNSIDTWLGPFLGGKSRIDQLKTSDLRAALEGAMSWKQRRGLDELAPSHLTVPSGSRIPIDYQSGEVPVLAVRLQEMFGLKETPTVAGGRVGLLLHLLSPARRPVQITSDLAGFWKNTYHDVKKDLKGRYPRHYWPDNPAEAEPTGRVKKR